MSNTPDKTILVGIKFEIKTCTESGLMVCWRVFLIFAFFVFMIFDSLKCFDILVNICESESVRHFLTVKLKNVYTLVKIGRVF